MSSSSPTTAPSDTVPDDRGEVTQPGAFTSGSATLTTPNGTATLALDDGLYIEMNDTVVVNFADGDMTDPATNAIGINGSAEELSITLIGPLLAQGVATECVVQPTIVDQSGVAGSFTCKGDVSGTFDARV